MRLSNGYTLWEGPSPEDGAPLALVVTGFRRPSANPKTGPMLQSFVFRTDVLPSLAVTTGQDISACNHCPLRQFTVRQASIRDRLPRGQKPTMCYVTTHYSVDGVYRKYLRGGYPLAKPRQLARLLKSRLLRLGSYGNPSNVPPAILRELLRRVQGHTSYDHNWAQPLGRSLKGLAMASVSSPAAKHKAQKMGWKTFRVLRPGEALEADEVLCQNAVDGTSCYDCLLCDGKTANVAIEDHGPTSRITQEKRRISLELVI
jgi:hypothetical protein